MFTISTVVSIYDETMIREAIDNVMERKKLFTGKMNLELEKRITKCFVWSIALYAAEAWTLTQTDRRLEAFKMWIWRRMEKISRLDKVTNEEVLRRVNEDRQMLNSV